MTLITDPIGFWLFYMCASVFCLAGLYLVLRCSEPVLKDPWMGLYGVERLPARHPEYGDTYHPDLPTWPDDDEQSIVPLLREQGFEVQFLQGEFSEEAFDDSDLYWKEMRDWQPEPPAGGNWRLAALGDTDDGPYATFVRPLALAG